MLTATQQLGARLVALGNLARAVGPIHDCGAKVHCMATIVAPAFAGAFALPDHSGLSRAQVDEVIVADYDRRHRLSDAYYARDTSHWAGR